MTSVHLKPHATLRITSLADEAAGGVTYQVDGPHATGSLTLIPAIGAFDDTPTGVWVQMGAGPANMAPAARPDKLTVYGVELAGGPILDPVEFLARHRSGLTLHRAHRPADGGDMGAPERTNAYANRIVHALVADWHARPDRDELLAAHTRHSAARRWHELLLWAGAGARSLAEAEARLAPHADRLARLEALAAAS